MYSIILGLLVHGKTMAYAGAALSRSANSFRFASTFSMMASNTKSVFATAANESVLVDILLKMSVTYASPPCKGNKTIGDCKLLPQWHVTQWWRRESFGIRRLVIYSTLFYITCMNKKCPVQTVADRGTKLQYVGEGNNKHYEQISLKIKLQRIWQSQLIYSYIIHT